MELYWNVLGVSTTLLYTHKLIIDRNLFGVIALILLYFTEFDSFAGLLLLLVLCYLSCYVFIFVFCLLVFWLSASGEIKMHITSQWLKIDLLIYFCWISSSTFGQNWPTLQPGLSAIAELYLWRYNTRWPYESLSSWLFHHHHHHHHPILPLE